MEENLMFVAVAVVAAITFVLALLARSNSEWGDVLGILVTIIGGIWSADIFNDAFLSEGQNPFLLGMGTIVVTVLLSYGSDFLSREAGLSYLDDWLLAQYALTGSIITATQLTLWISADTTWTSGWITLVLVLLLLVITWVLAYGIGLWKFERENDTLQEILLRVVLLGTVTLTAALLADVSLRIFSWDTGWGIAAAVVGAIVAILIFFLGHNKGNPEDDHLQIPRALD